MSGKTKIIVAYTIGVIVLAAMTITTLNPFAFPVPQVGLTRILPMLGFTVLIAGTALGGLLLYMMDEHHLVKLYIGIGLIASLAVAILVSNLWREALVRAVARKQGSACAQKVARQNEHYDPLRYSAREHGGYLKYFLRDDQYENAYKQAFYSAYKQTFLTRYEKLINSKKLYESGLEDGQNIARSRASNASIRGKSLSGLSKRELERLRLRHLPQYVEGYLEGYKSVKRR